MLVKPLSFMRPVCNQSPPYMAMYTLHKHCFDEQVPTRRSHDDHMSYTLMMMHHCMPLVSNDDPILVHTNRQPLQTIDMIFILTAGRQRHDFLPVLPAVSRGRSGWTASHRPSVTAKKACSADFAGRQASATGQRPV